MLFSVVPTDVAELQAMADVDDSTIAASEATLP